MHKAEMAVSAEIPDWSREESRRWWDPGRRLLKTIRRYQQWGECGAFWRVLRRGLVIPHRFWSVVCGAEVPLDCEIGGGLLLTHPNGVVIHAKARLGPNCLVLQQVTIGVGGRIPGAPIIGGHVDIGAGAKILGGVRLGNHSRVGANAVVLCDVAEGATAVGVPARVIMSASSPVSMQENT